MHTLSVIYWHMSGLIPHYGTRITYHHACAPWAKGAIDPLIWWIFYVSVIIFSFWGGFVADLSDTPLARKKISVGFCACHQSNQARLIYMGYIGGSPSYPKTAFSLRLLRFYHITWKYCTTRVEPFARALDEYLDAYNPLILTKSNPVSPSPSEKTSIWLLFPNTLNLTNAQPCLWATPFFKDFFAYLLSWVFAWGGKRLVR